ncbi:hypothetical protein ACHAW6_005445 [Cyclotella cf. meneghiniana]
MLLHPAPGDCSHLTAFLHAYWGGQFGNSIPNGSTVRKSAQQYQISLSSSKAEIIATKDFVTTPKILACQAHTNAPRCRCTMATSLLLIGWLPAQTRGPNLSTSMSTMFMNFTTMTR